MKFQDWKIQLRIASELSRWICQNKLSIEKASEKLDIDPKKLSLLLREQTYPSLPDLIKICETVGISSDYLLCLKN